MVLFLGIFISLAAAPQPDQSHDLSEIKPIDIDLNMSSQDIFNISELKLKDGIILKQNAVRNAGNSQDLLRLQNSGKIVIPNGNLDLNGRRILNVGKPENPGDAVNRSYVQSYADSNDDNGTDDQLIEVSGQMISLEDGGSIFVPYANNTDKLDGVELADIDWSNTALARNEVSPYDVGDTELSSDSSISGSSYNGTEPRNWGVAWEDAVDLNSVGNLSDGAVENAELANSGISVVAGNQLSGGGTPALGGSVTLDLNEGSGSGLDADTIDSIDSTSLCQSDGTNCPVDDTGTDDQNLQATSRTGSTVTIPIEDGSNTSFDDQTVPDDQSLSTTADGGSGTNDQITIESGNTIEVDDDFEANTNTQLDDEAATSNIDVNGNDIDSAGAITADNISLTGGFGTGGIDLNNEALYNLDSFSLNDPGPDGSIDWGGSAAEIYAAPIDDSNNDGYLQFVNDGGIAFEPGSDGTTEITVESDGTLDIKNNSALLRNGVDTGSIELDGNSDLRIEGRDPDQLLELTSGGDLVYREYYGSNPVFRVASEGSNDAKVSLEGSTQLDTNGNPINMADGYINNLELIQLSGDGSEDQIGLNGADLRIYDNANGNEEIVRFKENEDVEISNGDLNVSSGNINVANNITSSSEICAGDQC